MSLMPQYPRSRQIPYYETNIQPWMFLKNANTDCTAEHQNRSHFRISAEYILQLLLEGGKENILKFFFDTKHLEWKLKHAELPAVFYTAMLGKISPVVDGKDWQVCGNDGSISVNLRINMIKSWKNATSSWVYWALRYESKTEIPWARMHGWLLCRASKARLSWSSPSLMVSKTSHGGCLVKDVFMECYFFVWFGKRRV